MAHSISPVKKGMIVLGCDHAGYPLKEALLPFLRQCEDLTIEDVGCFNAKDSVDYPLISQAFAERFQEKDAAWGLLLCGSGVGVAIAANRYPWLRAVHAHDVHLARLSREHNDSNVLTMGARFVAPALAEAIVTSWLSTPFEGDRHQRRVGQLSSLGNTSSVPLTC